jgi:ABC-type uncharacterized transport system fused permease/ATPase subunit
MVTQHHGRGAKYGAVSITTNRKEQNIMNIAKRSYNKVAAWCTAIMAMVLMGMFNAQAALVAYDGTNVTFTPSDLADNIINAIVSGILAVVALWTLVWGTRKIIGWIRRG